MKFYGVPLSELHKYTFVNPQLSQYEDEYCLKCDCLEGLTESAIEWYGPKDNLIELIRPYLINSLRKMEFDTCNFLKKNSR